ncbi:MAG TPA: hypothetical protein VK753_04215, partial [Xanthomonadaceae bacterium]|nr:hypothetical protein [Xanthomonadaceae bacterium]
NGHVQSVIFTGMCMTLAFLLFVMGFLADLMATNRRLLERIEWRVRKLELSAQTRPGDDRFDGTHDNPSRQATEA